MPPVQLRLVHHIDSYIEWQIRQHSSSLGGLELVDELGDVRRSERSD